MLSLIVVKGLHKEVIFLCKNLKIYSIDKENKTIIAEEIIEESEEITD